MTPERCPMLFYFKLFLPFVLLMPDCVKIEFILIAESSEGFLRLFIALLKQDRKALCSHLALFLQKLPSGWRYSKCLRNANLVRGHPQRAVVILLLIILIAIPSLVYLSLILGLQDIPKVVRITLHWYQLDGWNAWRVRFHLYWLLICVFDCILRWLRSLSLWFNFDFFLHTITPCRPWAFFLYFLAATKT